MKFLWIVLFSSGVFAGLPCAVAKSPASRAEYASPLQPPTTWFSANDYPAVALRFRMEGATRFRLAIGADGRPSRCEIVESSGFDVLDQVTCDRAMANAQFAIPRGRNGKPVGGSTFTQRIVWRIPSGSESPTGENFASMIYTVDQDGAVTGCRTVIHAPLIAAKKGDQPCSPDPIPVPKSLVMALKGDFTGSKVEIEMRQATVFSPDLRAAVMAMVPGFAQRALNIVRFTVTRTGRVNDCVYEEQRGDEFLVIGYCERIVSDSFDPPFSAYGDDGLAVGRVISRVLLKTGQ